MRLFWEFDERWNVEFKESVKFSNKMKHEDIHKTDDFVSLCLQWFSEYRNSFTIRHPGDMGSSDESQDVKDTNLSGLNESKQSNR